MSGGSERREISPQIRCTLFSPTDPDVSPTVGVAPGYSHCLGGPVSRSSAMLLMMPLAPAGGGG
jgi:hypothetical protein